MNKTLTILVVLALIVVGGVVMLRVHEESCFPREIRFLQPENGIRIIDSSGTLPITVEAVGWEGIDLSATNVRVCVNETDLCWRLPYVGEGQYRGSIMISDLRSVGDYILTARLVIRYPDGAFLLIDNERQYSSQTFVRYREATPVDRLVGNLEESYGFKLPQIALGHLVIAVVFTVTGLLLGWAMKNVWAFFAGISASSLIFLSSTLEGTLICIAALGLSVLFLIVTRKHSVKVKVRDANGHVWEIEAGDVRDLLPQSQVPAQTAALPERVVEVFERIDRLALPKRRER